MDIFKANLNFTKDLENLDLSPVVKDKLSLLMSRTYKGSDFVIMTPIAKDHNPNHVLDDFNNLFESNRSKMNSTLIDLELANKSKFGPRSIALNWSSRKASLYDSFEVVYNDKIDKLVVPSAAKSLRPINLSKALSLLKNDTNSGLPFYERKGLVKDRTLKKFSSLLESKYPCILFTRTQENGKTRNVWGFPIADTLNEMMFYKPLLEFQKSQTYRSALISPDQVSRSMTSLILKAKSRGYSIVSIDFSAYDTTVKLQLQVRAFDYIKSLYQSNYDKQINYLLERFNTISILTPDGVISGSHGVPSGSTFTNEVDSIVQFILYMNLPFSELGNFQIQGDDGVYIVQDDQVEALYNMFESCGLKLNKGDKSYNSYDFANYLQNLYHVDYLKDGIIGGIYPIYRALNRILYQERWTNFEDFSIVGKDYYSIRTICILENCKHHPLFEELVKFVLKYDKYSLDYSNQGLINYVSMIKRTEGLEGILNNQYGDNVKGINNFATVKIIRKLS